MERETFVKRYIVLATRAAQAGIHHQHKVGAILVRNGNVISIGANSFKSHPLMGFKTLHAEVQALIGCRYKDISGSTMFTSRINKNGKVGMAKPCNICSEVLKSYGIRKVYFTTSDSIEEIKY